MSKPGRLERLYGGLGPEERVRLVVQDVNRGARPPEEVFLMPPGHQASFLSLLARVRGANGDLPCLLLAYGQDIRRLWALFGWLVSLTRNAREEASPPPHSVKMRRSVTEALQEGLRIRLQELRAVVAVVDEVALNLGTDPLQPEFRAQLDVCLEELATLTEKLAAFLGPFELPEPRERDLELVRALLGRSGESTP